MAVLVGTVALGLEKVSMEKTPLTRQLKDLQQKISFAITQLDTEISYVEPETKKRKIASLCNNGEFHFLLVVAGDAERKQYPLGKRVQWALHRGFVTAPMLGVMRHGLHVPCIFALTITSVACFILQKAGEVYGFDRIWFIPGVDDRWLFWIYFTTIAVTLFFAVIAHWLSGVEPRCETILTELRMKKKHEDERTITVMMRELEKFTKAGDAHPGGESKA